MILTRWKPHFCIYSWLLICLLSTAAWSQEDALHWNNAPDLPPAPGETTQAGLAGAFAGVHQDVMIVAGGANFPDQLPWEGGQKKWWQTIYVLEKSDEGQYQWKDNVAQNLPQSLAYGVSVSLPEGVLCIGGNNQQGNSNQVFLLSWNQDSQSVDYKEYPVLPEGFQADAGARIGQQVWVHGVQNGENQLLSLDLTTRQWTVGSGCPGPARMFSVAAAQSNGNTECFYLFGGRYQTPDSVSILKDAYVFNPVQQQWSLIGNITTGQRSDISVMAGSAIATGANNILLLGGDAGDRFLKRFTLEKKIAQTQDTAARTTLHQQLTEKFVSHPGFSREVLKFHTVTNTFSRQADFPGLLPVTTKALTWNQNLFLISGEIKPGIRTSEVWTASLPQQVTTFGWLNYLVLLLYFGVLIVIGVYFSRRQQSTADYFKGGNRIPWWAAGLSLFGTSLSAITFMAIPAKTYATDWAYFFLQMTPLLTAPIIVSLYIPFFRRLNVNTAYEYLEKRFNYLTRVLGSLSFIIFQIGRVGIVLYLPSLALHVVTDINIAFCILAMGIISIIYTMIGGIEAVIWTDVVQVVVLLGGAIVCLVLILIQTEGGVPAFGEIAATNDKLNLFNFALDFRAPTFWVVVLGGFFANLISSGSDQTMVQRYLTTKDEAGAARSAWTFAWLAIPATLIFFGLGTALFVFYQQHPGRLSTELEMNDAILPWFIINELPAGVSGLIIAGLFSAAMSSLSSSMNSAATAFTSDFYQRFRQVSDQRELVVARWATLVFGILGTGFALMMASWSIQSLWDQFQLFIGLFAGGLGGLFLLGITTRRANGIGAVIGLILSGVLQYYLTRYTSLNVLLFTMTGFVSCFVFSYLFSLLFPAYSKNLKGLTIHTLYR
ncbi:MAG: sodium/solute symporter [Cyclobacteriaceae bacterium]